MSSDFIKSLVAEYKSLSKSATEYHEELNRLEEHRLQVEGTSPRPRSSWDTSTNSWRKLGALMYTLALLRSSFKPI